MRADWIKLMIAAARLPLRNDPANNQFERPSAHGRIWFSTWLLSNWFKSDRLWEGFLCRPPAARSPADRNRGEPDYGLSRATIDVAYVAAYRLC